MIRALALFLFLAGLALPTDVLSGGTEGLLVTFFGLMAAGIIPAMSLLVANTLSPSFSVKRLDELKIEVSGLLAKLGQTLGFIVAGACLVIVAQLDLPQLPSELFDRPVAVWVQNFPERVIQSGSFMFFIVALDRLRVVQSAFLSVFNQRFEIVRKESEARTRGNARELGTPKTYFPKEKGFGAAMKVTPKEMS